MACGGCGGAAAARGRTGRALRTSGDGAPPSPVPEEQAKYVLITAEETRGYPSYADAARAQATYGGRVRTAR